MKPVIWLFLVCLAFSFDMRAQSGSSLRISVLPGYGWAKSTRVGSSLEKTIQSYGLGVGMRTDFVFGNRISVGLMFMAYRGESVDIISMDGIPVTLHTRMEYGGLDLAYEIPVSQGCVIKPVLGIGLAEPIGNFSAKASADTDVLQISASGVRPFVSPGIGTLIEISTTWFVGCEARYVAVADYINADAFLFLATVGIKLSTNQ
jgi:hypothetical protein